MFKYPIILLLTFPLLIGCLGPRLSEKKESYIVLGFDFTDYAEKGFLFTPESYLGRYESRGLIEVIYDPEIIKESQRGYFTPRPGYSILNDRMGSAFQVKQATAAEVILEIYRVAETMGADAIVRFHIQPYSIRKSMVEIPTIKVSGYAIKRLD